MGPDARNVRGPARSSPWRRASPGAAPPDIASAPGCARFSGVATRDHLGKALGARRQSKHVAFRASFDPTSDRQWCELVRDLVAMANTDGGALVLGLDDAGAAVGVDPAIFRALDRSSVTERVRHLTGYDLPELTVRRAEKDTRPVLALVVERASVPIPFTRACETPAISPGTVFVRRGRRSVSATRRDLEAAIEHRLDEERRTWRSRVAEVIRIPASVHVSAAAAKGVGDVKQVTEPGAPGIRIVDQADAPAYRLENPDSVYPYRQKELIARLRQLLPDGTTVTGHTLMTINWAHGTRERPEWTYHPKFGSVQYNEDFARWIVEQVGRDPQFFDKAHRHWYAIRYGRPFEPRPDGSAEADPAASGGHDEPQ